MADLAELIDEDDAFAAWVRTLDEDVIQYEFGYEEGEFSVYPELWHPLYAEGLTPGEAWRRALDAHKAAREKERQEQAENWARIQAADAAAILLASQALPPKGDDR